MVQIDIILDDNEQHQKDAVKAMKELTYPRSKGLNLCRTIQVESVKVSFK